MKPVKSAREILDLYYNDMRSHLLEVAAAFDRIERAGGAEADPRLQQLRAAAAVAVAESGSDRTKAFLELLSQ